MLRSLLKACVSDTGAGKRRLMTNGAAEQNKKGDCYMQTDRQHSYPNPVPHSYHIPGIHKKSTTVL